MRITVYIANILSVRFISHDNYKKYTASHLLSDVKRINYIPELT